MARRRRLVPRWGRDRLSGGSAPLQPEEPDVPVRPGAEPVLTEGDEVGVLLCHGFTGNPVSMRPWAEALAAAGRSVRVPRLPGHGTSWREMNSTRWPDWYAEVDRALSELRETCSTVVVGGLSMGGALALRLAIERPHDVDGLLLVNPAVRLDDRRLALLPALRFLSPSLPAVGDDIKKDGVTEGAYDRVPSHALLSMLALFKDVVPRLPEIEQPLLLFRSPEDHVVPASSSATILMTVSSDDATEILLEESYHVATLDNDAPLIFARSLDFVDRVATLSREAST